MVERPDVPVTASPEGGLPVQEVAHHVDVLEVVVRELVNRRRVDSKLWRT